MSGMFCTINAQALMKSEYRELMLEYLLLHHHDDLVQILEGADASTSVYYSVAVNCLDLLMENCALATVLLHFPGEYMPTMDEAVLAAQQRIYDEGASSGAGGPANTDWYSWTVKTSTHLRLHHLPACRELCKATVTSIRAADINGLLSVSGTVIRTGKVKLMHSSREYVCVKCKHRFACEVDIEQRHSMQLPELCPSDGLSAKPCTGNKFEPVDGTEVCRDYQEVRIQEQVHRLTVGSIPRSITLILQDDLVDRCKPGDDVTVVGMLRKRWRPLVKDARPDVELAITAEHVRVRNEERGADRVSREMELDFTAFWERARAAGNELGARDWLLSQCCPSLSGMYLVKLATLLTLLGGVGHTDRTGMRVRGESHMLLVGDAGVGKSQVLRYAARLSPRSVLTTGIGSTAAGLTCTAVKDASGEWMLEAGALVLADGGLCCVDEFDSIKNEERVAVLEAMEQQTISVAKAGMVCKLRTKCTVVAATNPKGGKMERGGALHTQTGLATPLISRFDIVLLLSDSQVPPLSCPSPALLRLLSPSLAFSHAAPLAFSHAAPPRLPGRGARQAPRLAHPRRGRGRGRRQGRNRRRRRRKRRPRRRRRRCERRRCARGGMEPGQAAHVPGVCEGDLPAIAHAARPARAHHVLLDAAGRHRP